MATETSVHSRIPPIDVVDISQLALDPSFQVDRRMVKLITQSEKGDIKCALTRLPEAQITTGFFQRKNGRTEYVSNLKTDAVPRMVAVIKQGLRPSLSLYWNSLSKEQSKFVCPDDEAALAAYRQLGICDVPCLIYRPKSVRCPEAAIWAEKKDGYIRMAGSVPSNRTSVAMRFGLSDPKFELLVRDLTTQCVEARKAIQEFHEDGSLEIHYHHVLHATLLRHERVLDSIQLLVGRGRIEHAEALLRLGYEAFLNFYVDWLSPSFFGPRLQLLSMVRHAELVQDDPQQIERLRASLNVMTGFSKLLETTSEKARLSPLGSAFHDQVYPPLSLVSHQSYANVEADAKSFDNLPTEDFDSRVRQLGRWLDVITTAMVMRIRDDIGVGSEG